MQETDFYDDSLCRKPDVEFYVRTAQQFPEAAILEVGCGTGRILLEIAKQGIAIDGIDGNKERLDICRKKLSELPNAIQTKVSVYECLSDDFMPAKKYALIFLPFRVLQEMGNITEQEASLRHLKSLLQPGGKLILDIWYPNPEVLASFARDLNIKTDTQSLKNAKGIDYKVSFRCTAVDFKMQTFSAEKVYEYSEDDESKEAVYSWNSRYLNRYEVEYLLKHLGFEIEAVYGDFAETLFQDCPKPKNMIFVAKA